MKRVKMPRWYRNPLRKKPKNRVRIWCPDCKAVTTGLVFVESSGFGVCIICGATGHMAGSFQPPAPVVPFLPK